MALQGFMRAACHDGLGALNRVQEVVIQKSWNDTKCIGRCLCNALVSLCSFSCCTADEEIKPRKPLDPWGPWVERLCEMVLISHHMAGYGQIKMSRHAANLMSLIKDAAVSCLSWCVQKNPKNNLKNVKMLFFLWFFKSSQFTKL